MTPQDVQAWFSAMREAGLAKTDKQAMALLGVGPGLGARWKREGLDGTTAKRTALAMAALLTRLRPYSAEPRPARNRINAVAEELRRKYPEIRVSLVDVDERAFDPTRGWQEDDLAD